MKTIYLYFAKTHIAKTLLVSSAALSVMYGVLVARTSIALVEHKNTIHQTEELSRVVAELEGDIMQQSRSIDLAYAKSVGLVTPASQQFVTRRDTVSMR
jgi:hypothetical protein